MSTSATSALSALRRPRLLIRAARFGIANYDRTRSLRRIFPETNGYPGADPVAPLIEEEAAFETRRVRGDASYSVARHVEVLVALMCEARRMMQGGTAV